MLIQELTASKQEETEGRRHIDEMALEELEEMLRLIVEVTCSYNSERRISLQIADIPPRQKKYQE